MRRPSFFVPALLLTSCGRRFQFVSDDLPLIHLLSRIFNGMRAAAVADGAAETYRIDRHADGFAISGDRLSSFAEDDADLVYQVDKVMTLALQHQRQDLFFLHAAALALGSKVAVLAAPPGTGKSTVTLALTGLGLTYLSDELAPIELDTLAIEPYPHGLCLKNLPPPPLQLPSQAITCGARFHVPMPAPGNGPWKLEALVFLRRDDERFVRRRITAGSAAAMLMANALNQLAHEGDGLEAAVRLAGAAPAYDVNIADLDRAAASIRDILGDRL